MAAIEADNRKTNKPTTTHTQIPSQKYPLHQFQRKTVHTYSTNEHPPTHQGIFATHLHSHITYRQSTQTPTNNSVPSSSHPSTTWPGPAWHTCQSTPVHPHPKLSQNVLSAALVLFTWWELMPVAPFSVVVAAVSASSWDGRWR